jgi:hypothetical protein
MTNSNKQLSNPFSTGGGGPNFETRVQASFVTLMLSGGFSPCLPPWPIKKIKLQGRYTGYETDDLIVFVENEATKEERKLLCQIKHSISITKAKTNKVFGEVIQAGWRDFNNVNVFTKGTDSIALITGPLSVTDINDVRTILEWARSSDSVADFLTKVNQTNFSSKKKREKLIAFQSHLKNANGGNDVSDDEFWQFMKSFNLLGCDLDIKAGATLSFLQSLIGQYSVENAEALWAQIVNEVQSANQNAGTITVGSISEDIRSVFQKPGVKTIPKDLGIKPSIMAVTNLSITKLAIANFLGGWNENIKNDKQVVEQIAHESYSGWISEVREIVQLPESPLSLRNGIWTVGKRQEVWQELGSRLFDEHLDRFKQIAVDVLREPDPQFELASEERFMANIKGEVLKHSHSLRKGLAESLALLGSQPGALKNCSRGKAESTAIISIREIFEDSNWVLWASLNNLLPTLAEAAPGEFLSAVENALRKKPCPFDEIFSQENTGVFGNNYMTGLLWALETLAWDEQYLVQVTVILGNLASHDPGGNWGNRPANSLMTIFLPWLPQTVASIEKRKAAVLTLQKEFPAIAWKLLLNLLPNQHQTSMGCRKPVWRKIIPDNWGKGITNEEYWKQISAYADIAVEAAKDDIAKLKELITHLDNLTGPSFEKLLAHLESEKVINRSEEDRTPLWIALKDFILKHRRYADAKWALNPELVGKIEQLAKNLAPQQPQNLYTRLFSERDLDLYEDRKNWEEQRKKLEENRRNAIREIIKDGGLEAVFRFAEKVDSPDKVGFSLGFVAEAEVDILILPNLLETEDKKKTSFVTGFIWGRYCNQGWKWVNQVDASKWPNVQVGKFLSYLLFKEETWKLSERLLGDNEDKYWGIVDANAYQAENNLDYAIDKLIKHSRPKAAIRCAYVMLNLKKTFNKTQVIKALLDAISSNETIYSGDGYEITEVIEVLQNDPETNQNDLLSIEWAYLPLLSGPGKGASPKLLEQKIASEPDFFCEVIRLLYRSKKETKSNKEPTEQQKLIAQNAWHLLNDWETLPGKQVDGSFSADNFNKWLKNVKTKCKQSGHFAVAMSTIGNVLIHYIPDPNGLWIHKAIAEALNAEDAEKMRNGFRIGLFNSLGVHWIDPTGKPEKELAAKYRKQAEEVENSGYYRLANTLKSLAGSFEREAERIIEERDD